jgi:hypothetical protein
VMAEVDQLVPDTAVEREFSVTKMTLWRWTRDPTLGFPAAIKINGRTYRSRQQLEAWKTKLMTAAMKAR